MSKDTYAQGWDDHVAAAKAQIEELRAVASAEMIRANSEQQTNDEHE